MPASPLTSATRLSLSSSSVLRKPHVRQLTRCPAFRAPLTRRVRSSSNFPSLQTRYFKKSRTALLTRTVTTTPYPSVAPTQLHLPASWHRFSSQTKPYTANSKSLESTVTRLKKFDLSARSNKYNMSTSAGERGPEGHKKHKVTVIGSGNW